MIDRRVRASTSGTDRGGSDRGAALLEFAIALPVLAIFLLGIFSSGSAINSNVRLNQAARDSARYGSRLDPNGYTAYSDSSYAGNGWATNVASLALNRDTKLTAAKLCVAAVEGNADGTVSPYSATAGPGVGGTYSVGATGGVCWQPTSGQGVVPGQVYVQVDARKVVPLDLYLYNQSITMGAKTMMPAEWNAT